SRTESRRLTPYGPAAFPRRVPEAPAARRPDDLQGQTPPGRRAHPAEPRAARSRDARSRGLHRRAQGDRPRAVPGDRRTGESLTSVRNVSYVTVRDEPTLLSSPSGA